MTTHRDCKIRCWCLLGSVLGLAAITVASAAAQGGWSLSSGSSGRVSQSSTVSTNQSLHLSATSEVVTSIASRVSSRKAWAEASKELLGRMARSSAEIVIALSVNGSSSLEETTRASFEDIRAALGASPLSEAPACTIKKLYLDDKQLVPLGIDAWSPLDLLLLTDRMAHRPEQAEALVQVSRSLFDCGTPDPDERLRGAAALVLALADYHDFKSAHQTTEIEPTDRDRAIWESERRRMLGQPSEAADAKSPALCLAMSGGGVRSAAFQLGALQGLAEIGLLEEVDVASAVSGGSYPLAWLITDQDSSRKALRSEAALEKLDGRFSWSASTIEGTAGALSAILTQPLRWLSSRLSTTSIPDPTYAHYHYAQLLRAAYALEDRTLSSFVATRRPFPIFVATARLGEKGPCANGAPEERPFFGEAGRLQRSVFEMTPFGGGSEQLGFSGRFPDDVSLPMTVATSGAALDDPYSNYCQALRDIGVTLGIRLGRWRPEIGWSSPEARGEPSGPLHLSDGGFSDNLGLHPLVRRSCQRILVVDATWDPHLTFDHYQRLREALLRQEGVSLESDALSKLATAHSDSCKEKGGPDCFVRAKPEDGASGPTAGRLAADAVFAGALRIPGGTTAAFQYVKLAVDEAHLDQYPRPLRRTINRRAGKARDKTARERLFPFIPTSNQRLSADDFMALRLLGCYLVEKSFASERKPPDHSPCQSH
jgi:predicted acylesterase/phospholipase RssA